MAQEQTPLQALRPENIPAALRAQRWAPWKAVWNAKKGKWDKIPCHPNGYGLSTAKPERWTSLDAALAAVAAHPDLFAGVGFCATGMQDLTGVDLDHCVSGNTIAPWALEIVQQLDSYAELSPSGTGLRIVVQGQAPADWTNHEQGIEVYAGHAPRFLTVTGQKLKMAPAEVRRPDPAVLGGLAERFARERTTATVITLELPELVDELVLPDLGDLDVPYQVRDFLTDGAADGDRSRQLFSAALALYGAGLGDAEVLTLLATNPHAMEIALDHRRQDGDRALMYLWVEHCQKARSRSTSKVATLDDFEDLTGGQASAPAAAPGAPAKALRFAFETADAFANHSAPMEWLIKGLLPKADVGAIYGASGAGKSFFALDLVMAVAQGLPWRGRRTTQGAIAYVCAEGAGGFRLRIQAYAQHHGVDLAGLPLFVLGDAPNLLEKNDVKDLVAALRLLPGLALIIVDTLAQVTPGANENSGEDMGRALGHCKALKKATGAMVVMVAHSGKDEARGMRGWSGIKGALDVEIQVERSDKYRAATVTKLKDGQGEGDEFPFELDTVVMGLDADGEELTSCVLKSGAAVPKSQRKAEPKGVWQQTVMRVAIGLTDLPGAVTSSQLIDATVAEMPAEEGKRDRRRNLAMRAVESLVASNRLSLAGGTVEVL